MKKLFDKITALLFITIFLVSACSKDYSVETQQVLEVIVPSKGSLQSITAHGNFYQGITLTANNYISAIVNIANYGTFQLHSDTVNGCWFTSDASYANGTGTQTIILKGYGTPINLGTYNFHVYFLSGSASTSITFATPPHISTETDYFPMSVGSYWTEDTIANASLKDTLRYSVSSLTQTIGANTYTLFLTNHRDTILYRKDHAGHYYEYSSLLAPVGVDKFEYKFLDDQLPEGSSWQTDPVYGIYKIDATQSLPLKIVLKCTIISKNQSFQLKTQKVDSVIHIQEQLILTSPDGNSNYTTLFGIDPNDAYYGKKIGLIYYSIPFTGFLREARSWYIE